MLYLHKPDNFHQNLEAVGCFVIWRGRILMLKRVPDDDYPNQWGFPSGKIKKGEGPTGAMFRELKEETGLKVNYLIPLGMGFVIYPKINFPYHMYKVRLPSNHVPVIKLNPREHVAHRFDTPENVINATDTMADCDLCVEFFYY